VVISRLQLRRLQDVPALLRHSLQLRRGFRTVPGAISLHLAASPTRGTFWTWSSWTDARSMDDYVSSGSHRTLLVDYRNRLSEARFLALRPGGPPLPRDWPEVRAQLARVSATESANVPIPVLAGETR
jgi:quinol monooxygenase YgiN